MRLGLTLATVAVEIEEEREIDAEGEIDAAEGATNKAIRLYRSTFTPFDCWWQPHNVHHVTYADLNHRGLDDETPLLQEVRPLTIRRSLTSLRLNLWDKKQRKKAKFDTVKN